MIFHQPRFPISLPWPPFQVGSCKVTIIWPVIDWLKPNQNVTSYPAFYKIFQMWSQSFFKCSQSWSAKRGHISHGPFIETVSDLLICGMQVPVHMCDWLDPKLMGKGGRKWHKSTTFIQPICGSCLIWLISQNNDSLILVIEEISHYIICIPCVIVYDVYVWSLD